MSKVVMGVVSRILELGIFLLAAVGLGVLVLAIR
jgi:hypothetical protein